MIVLDIETSGTNPKKHSILSLGAVWFEQPEHQFYSPCTLRYDRRESEPDALRVNGFGHADLDNTTKPSFNELMNNFYEWTRPVTNKTLCGANIGTFDWRFLHDGLEHCGINMRLGGRVCDLFSTAVTHMTLAGIVLPIANKRTEITVDDIYAYIGIPPEPLPHHALFGALRTAEAFSRLWYAEHLLPDYARYPIPEHILEFRARQYTRPSTDADIPGSPTSRLR